jgi:hypothetical protein
MKLKKKIKILKMKTAKMFQVHTHINEDASLKEYFYPLKILTTNAIYCEMLALLGCYAAYVVTDASGQPISTIFEGEASFFLDCFVNGDGTDRFSRNVGNDQAIQEEWCLTQEHGTNRLFRNVSNYPATLRNIP